MKLIFIHGRSQQDYEELKLKQYWIDNWVIGLKKSGLDMPQDVQVEFPYYGKLLINLINEAESPQQTLLKTTKKTLPKINEAQQIAFYYAFLNEMAQNMNLPAEKRTELLTHQSILGGIQDWGMVHDILKIIDETKMLGTLPLELFTKDVFMYLTNSGIKKQINNFVKTAFDKQPCVVVGHSLGSIITYLVLKNSSSYPIKKIITVGSPLGVESIRPYLEPPFKMPKSVSGGWFNAFDKRDIVALYPLDNIHFSISPPIENYDNVDNESDNRHDIAGYLSDAEVAKRIYEALS